MDTQFGRSKAEKVSTAMLSLVTGALCDEVKPSGTKEEVGSHRWRGTRVDWVKDSCWRYGVVATTTLL